MTHERRGAATVTAQDGTMLKVKHDRRELTARMVGFPLGFMLRPGERVILADEPSGLTARPLVRTVRSPLTRDAVERDREVRAGDDQFVIQDSTVLEFEPSQAGPGEEPTLWIVESENAERPEQVIAARWPRR